MYKKCHYCKEEILEDAIKCKHCGSMLGELPSGGTTIIDAFANQYEIIGELGRGGMSTVYKARQIALDRIVALKVVPIEFTHDKDFIARLRREAQSSAKLSHPNIVTTYDVGEMGGYPYITLEYLSGGTLSEYIHKHGKLSEDQIKKIIVPILEGLSYAHTKGIVHRDIKSSNIMFNEHQHPILMDFGIARSTEGTKLTKTGTTIGTPEYMSPEQAMGKETDQRSDIYSIGVVMYEMATCNVPFRADTVFGLIHKVVNEEPDLSQLHSVYSESLISIITRLLNKNPEQRFQNTRDIISALSTKHNKTDTQNITIKQNTESVKSKTAISSELFVTPDKANQSQQDKVQSINHSGYNTKTVKEIRRVNRVLIFLIVCSSIVFGIIWSIKTIRDNKYENNLNAVNSELQNYASQVIQFYYTPESQGGAGRDGRNVTLDKVSLFIGFLGQFYNLSTDNGEFRVTSTDHQWVELQGVGKVKRKNLYPSVTTTIDLKSRSITSNNGETNGF